MAASTTTPNATSSSPPSTTGVPKKRSSRRRSSILRSKQTPKLFDYFVVVDVEKVDYNAPTDKTFDPNSKDMGWEPTVKYSYNANKIISTLKKQNASTSSSTSTTSTTTNTPPKIDARYSKLHTNKESAAEELELMEQIRKFTFCDLSDLVNKFNALSDNDRASRKFYKTLLFKHGLQSESFTFCVTKSSGQRLYGHCRRLFTPDVNLKASEMPTALVLISSHGFHQLFNQIMDYIVARWFCCHQAVFPVLDALLLAPQPAFGDTFRINIKSQVSKDDEIITFKLNTTYHVSLKRLFQTLTVDNILWLISCVLTERRIIFYCNSLETLSECVHGLISLIYPFRWTHIFVPILPESLLNYLAAPMPFVIGIKSYLAHTGTDFSISSVILVDLDKQSVRSSSELQNKLLPLPHEPSWKLKRELKKQLKKYSLSLQTHRQYVNKYINYNYKSLQTKLVNKGASILNININDAAKGWDDLAFYDAFLAFFVLFIGDWRNFFDENNKNVPKPPYHLSSDITDASSSSANSSHSALQQSTTAVSSTPPANDLDFTKMDGKANNVHHIPTNNTQNQSQSPNKASGGVGGIGFGKLNLRKLADAAKAAGGIASGKLKKKIIDEKKKRNIKKDAKMFYNSEALKYIELLCQSQLFQMWFIRQQKESVDSIIKLSGVQDRYDYIMNNWNKIGASYTNCYKYLCQDSKYRNANNNLHTNIKQVIELTASFTSNKDYQQLTDPKNNNSIRLTLNKLSKECTSSTASFNIINNLILYRLNDCYGSNNFPHGIMTLALLAHLIQNSTDRILIKSLNKYVFYANVLTKYKHDKIKIADDMRKIATKVTKLCTELDELKTKKIKNYVAFGDDYEYKYNEKKSKNNNKNGQKNIFIDDKIAQIDFNNISSNQNDQNLVNFLAANTYDKSTDFVFTENSQFRANDINGYRKRMLKGEVRMIPPFEHLHKKEFKPDMYDYTDNDDDDDNDNDLLGFLDDIKANNNTFTINSQNNPGTNQNQNQNQPKIQTKKQTSIFNLGKEHTFGDDNDDNDKDNNSDQSDYDMSGGFLTRTDTRRDGNTGKTIRDIKNNWITNFDVNSDDNNNNNNTNHNDFNSDTFNSGIFSKSSDDVADFFSSSEFLANSNSSNGSKKKISSVVTKGFGKTFNKIKTTAKAVKKRRNKNSITNFDLPNYNNNNNNDNPFRDGFNFGFNSSTNNNNKQNNSKQNGNNIFGDLLAGQQSTQPKQKQKPQQKPVANLDDLFGDLLTNNNNDNNTKKSIPDLMATAYTKNNNNTMNNVPKLKKKDVFDDLNLFG